ncbi:MATE family efflux transporter DinF [Candidatus Pantoea deserta]|uniref:MATE family efflux transporter DinF n=1 Tax=Candidatus Pantoea deserta TaxID=1869313 RepID=A0A3N4PBG1_9GAMM|nr:MATE family efflux transporter DinF [Pantoea deserta]RPE04728.1 MATE family efflux transporter DinF [Pantoea deserta]
MRLFTANDRHLWRLALPMILSNITVPLLGLVDTAVIGHLDSPVYLGGVAIGATTTSFVFMLLLFLRMSTTGFTAQAFGARDALALARALTQPLLMAVCAGVLFILLRDPLSSLAGRLAGGNPLVLEQAALFIHIRWLSAPATLANMVILGWLLGVQYARAPVVLLVVGNSVNIALDLWLVLGLKWGVAGAATATALAEYVTLAVGLMMVWRVAKRRGITMTMLKRSWRGDVSRLLRLNRDIMLRSLLLQLCFASLTLIGARLGPEVVAANAVLLMFITFTAYALDGFAYAVEAVSGEAWGARDGDRLLAVWHAACRQAGLVALGFALIYAVSGESIVTMLTSLASLRQQVDRYLIWQIILPLAGVWCYLLDGLFVGATRGREMRNSMAVAALGYFVTLLTLPWLGNHGLWLAVTVFLALRGLSLWYIWRREWRLSRWFNS